MRLYGYQQHSDTEEPITLSEVSVEISSLTLRRLAKFFLHVADEMDRHGPAFGHEHFADYDHEMASSPDIIVVRESKRSEE